MSFSSTAPLNWDADLARILEVQRLLGPLSQKLSERSEFLRGQKAADERLGSASHGKSRRVFASERGRHKAGFLNWLTFCEARRLAWQSNRSSS